MFFSCLLSVCGCGFCGYAKSGRPSLAEALVPWPSTVLLNEVWLLQCLTITHSTGVGSRPPRRPRPPIPRGVESCPPRGRGSCGSPLALGPSAVRKLPQIFLCRMTKHLANVCWQLERDRDGATGKWAGRSHGVI